MKSFEYTRPTDLGSAVVTLANVPSSMPIAGGTNLVDLLRLGVERPEVVVDISRLGLDDVEEAADGGLRIGAGVSNSHLAAHPLVRARYPMLSRALVSAASGQLRNMASTGGNLLQRTRCVYFMDATKPCNKREPGTGCPAIEGASRELAILGASRHCIATHPGDMAVALTALDAVVHFETASGHSSLPVHDFYRLPGEAPERDTDLPRGALITHIDIPPLAFGGTSTYRKARDRRSYAFGLVTVAAALDVRDGEVRGARIALGGVAHKPWRAATAEQLLEGREPDAAAFHDAAQAEMVAARPTKDNAFKVDLATRLMVGVLLELVGGNA